METESQEAREDASRLVTRILNGAVREMDLIGRYDRECFSLLLPQTTRHEGCIVAQRLCESIDLSVPPFPDSPVPFTVRIGVAEVVEGDDVVRLLQRAEAAMSAGEKNGIGCHNGQWPEVVEPIAQSPTSAASAEPGAAGIDDPISTV